MRDVDTGRLLFSNLNAMLTRSALNDIVQSAQRPMAEGTQFLCAGRAEFPEILQIFRPIFSQFLRDLDAGLALYLALERTPTRKRAAKKSYAVRAITLADFTQLFCARRAETFSETLQLFRASCAQNLWDPDAGRLLFRI